nr:hypothetical protein [Tanacetum cinerariifolium]
MSLTFAETHNMVAYLTKSDASRGFNQVIDFLNGSYIKYALTVNLNIYVSCIKQFWNTVAIKQVNDVTRLQDLVDKKKVVTTKAAIREVLRLDDVEGVDCLPNEEIFAELARMGKGFSGVETPLFEGVIVEQVIEEGGDVEEHVEDVTAGDAAQGDDTAAHREVPTVSQEPFIPSLTPPTPPPQPPQDLSSTSQVQHTPPQLPQPQPQAQQQAADFLMSLLQEALDACVALIRRVELLEYDKVAQALEITKLKRRVKKLEKENRVKVLKLRRLKRVGTSQRVDTSEDTVMDDASNQGRKIDELDKDDVVALMDDKEEDKKEEKAKVVEDDQVQGRQAESQAEIYKIDMDHASKVLSMQEGEPAEVQEVVDVVTTAKLITKVVTATSEIVTAASTIISAAEPQVPAATIAAALTKEQMEEEESRALQSINETLAQKAAKRRKLNEEVEDLKTHLEIVPDEDDDVYTEATPLARKVPVVDYEIIN